MIMNPILTPKRFKLQNLQKSSICNPFEQKKLIVRDTLRKHIQTFSDIQSSTKKYILYCGQLL